MFHVIIHRRSYPFIRSVAEYIVESIRQTSTHFVRVSLVDDVNGADIYPGSVVLIIGENLPRFNRDTSCYYVYINFSLLYKLRWYRPIGPKAREWIEKKHDLFVAKLPCIDMVLDFYQQQTLLLRKRLTKRGVSVRHMPIGVVHSASIRPTPMDECQWDICVVGSQSRRRREINEQLDRLGFNLSPTRSDDFSAIVSRSRIVLNVHYADCDTFEIPRIVEALALGRCVVTEPCYGMEMLVPAPCYRVASYGDIVGTVSEFFSRPDDIALCGSAGADFYSNVHLPRCNRIMKSIVLDLQGRVHS